MKWYWGPPANPGMMKFHTGTLFQEPKGAPRRRATKHYTTHEIVGLYGLQVGKTFIGRIALGAWGSETQQDRPDAG